MATRPNRRDLIKMGAAAGGIAVAGPIVTTFNVPAAAALTSTCGCTGGATLFRKEILWSGTTWQVTIPTAGACAPACFTGTTVRRECFDRYLRRRHEFELSQVGVAGQLVR